MLLIKDFGLESLVQFLTATFFLRNVKCKWEGKKKKIETLNDIAFCKTNYKRINYALIEQLLQMFKVIATYTVNISECEIKILHC